MWLSQELFLQSALLRRLVLMKTKITYYSLSLVSSYPHLLPSAVTLSYKTVIQRKQTAGSPTPHPLTRTTNQWVHIRTKSFLLRAFPSDSLGCCSVACVSFIYLRICCSRLVLNCANEESSAATVHDLALVLPSRLQIMKGNIFLCLKPSLCFPAGIERKIVVAICQF